MLEIYALNATITLVIIQITIFTGLLLAPKQVTKRPALNIENIIEYLAFFLAFITGAFQNRFFGEPLGWFQCIFWCFMALNWWLIWDKKGRE